MLSFLGQVAKCRAKVWVYGVYTLFVGFGVWGRSGFRI